jgi:hypothetical protein
MASCLVITTVKKLIKMRPKLIYITFLLRLFQSSYCTYCTKIIYGVSGTLNRESGKWCKSVANKGLLALIISLICGSLNLLPKHIFNSNVFSLKIVRQHCDGHSECFTNPLFEMSLQLTLDIFLGGVTLAFLLR